MHVRLAKIDKDNYEAVCDLTVSDDQIDFVADNTWSLVEAQFNPGYETRAIYYDDLPVGFIMWVPVNPDKASIWRFMIDENFQYRGIGRRALVAAIEEIRSTNKIKAVEICYNPKNPVAREFYASVGFKEIGMDKENEDMIASLILPNDGPIEQV